jgi:exopolyphosphatase / guanosine-5'-triphosphate,3'-diphosphate pyrophosphatase
VVAAGALRAGTGRARARLMTRRVAAVDCGTNSLRLLIADVDPDRALLTDVARRMEIVRLGQGVDATGRLAPEALTRTTGVLADYAAVIAASGAHAIRMVATSATRDAANAEEFTRRVVGVLGVAPEVLTGAEEARLSFTGATAELAAEADGGLFLVADIGGGSTEFVLGRAGSAGPTAHAMSVNVGCVRMSERHLHGDPPTPEQVAAAAADIDTALDAVNDAMPVREARTLIGLAGSVTTVAGIAMGLPAYDAARIHHARVSAADVHEVTGSLLAQTRAVRAAIGVMHPGRVDVIGGGALVLDRIMGRFGFTEVLVSEHDILDGIAWSLAGDSRG